MIGEEAVAEAAPVIGPSEGAPRRKSANEDLVDAAGKRCAEALKVVGRQEIEVAAEHDSVLVPDEVDDTLELIRTPRVAVGDDDAVVQPDRVHHPPEPDRADDGRPPVDELPTGEDRVCLPRERRTQKTVIDRREPAAEACALHTRPARDDARSVHAAPSLELTEGPERKLLQADDIRSVAGDELDHLPQERTALRRVCVAVKDVPCPY